MKQDETACEPLDDDAKNVMYGNQLVRLCCNGCKKEFAKAPAKLVAQVTRAAAAKGEHSHDDDADGGRLAPADEA